MVIVATVDTAADQMAAAVMTTDIMIATPATAIVVVTAVARAVHHPAVADVAVGAAEEIKVAAPTPKPLLGLLISAEFLTASFYGPTK